MTTTSPEVQTSLFGVEEVKPRKKSAKSAKKAVEPQKQQKSPVYDKIMALGKSCNYIRLDVNGTATIGAGIHGWDAYASLAFEKRIEEIKRAIAKEARG